MGCLDNSYYVLYEIYEIRELFCVVYVVEIPICRIVFTWLRFLSVC